MARCVSTWDYCDPQVAFLTLFATPASNATVQVPAGGSIFSNTNLTPGGTGAIHFNNFGNQNISFSPSGGISPTGGTITISDTGIYEIIWGISATTAAAITELQINGITGPAAQYDYRMASTSAGGGRTNTSMAVILQLTTPGGSTLKVVNVSFQTPGTPIGISLADIQGTNSAPCAFMTIKKLSTKKDGSQIQIFDV